MYVVKCLYCFCFDDYLLIDQNISKIFTNNLPFIANSNSFLFLCC